MPQLEKKIVLVAKTSVPTFPWKSKNGADGLQRFIKLYKDPDGNLQLVTNPIFAGRYIPALLHERALERLDHQKEWVINGQKHKEQKGILSAPKGSQICLVSSFNKTEGYVALVFPEGFEIRDTRPAKRELTENESTPDAQAV